MEGGAAAEGFVQNVVVMRHGDRADRAGWADRTGRPWDPSLLDAGKARARETGRTLREAGFPIHRVVVSPFLRCLQTAAEVVSTLCAVDEMDGRDGVVFDFSKVKVSIEYGLCEVIGRAGVNPSLAPKDGNWFPAVSELQSLFPADAIDHSYEPIYKSIPRWEEAQEDAWKRFAKVIQAIADKYPHENLLLVTHGQCVAISVFTFLEGVQIKGIKYCACTHLRRKMNQSGPEGSFELYNQTGVGIIRN